MTNNVITLGASVPAFLARPDAARINQAAATGTGGPSVNKISIKGGKFRLIVGGEEVKVLEKNSISLAVIRANEGLHKAYYSKKWTPGSDDPPDCYSNDGVTPAADAVKPQAKGCAGCPHNEWGSYVNPDTGAKGRLCSDSKQLAVLPPQQLGNRDMPPYMLTVPAASMKSFGAMLTSLNNLSPPVPYNGVVVDVSFDTDASYPKLVFKPVDYLTAEQYEASSERYDAAETKACVGMQLIRVTDVTETPAPKAAPAPAPAEEFEDDDEEEEVPKPAPRKRKPKAAPAPTKSAAPADDFDYEPAPKPAAKQAAREEDAEEAEFTDAPPKPAAKTTAPKATADLDDVFGEGWD